MRRLSVDSLSARLWPPRCVLCDAGVASDAPRAAEFCADASLLRVDQQDICGGCLQDLPWLFGACSACGLPLPAAAAIDEQQDSWIEPGGLRLCGACLAEPLFSRCRVAFEYSYPINQLVQALKFRRHRSMGRVLGYLLGLAVLQACTEEGFTFAASAPSPVLYKSSLFNELGDLPEIIVPVPLHRWRLFTRGYNQAAEIAACLPPTLRQRVACNLCQRVRRTPTQTSLARQQRIANLAGAFALTSQGKRMLPGKHVAVLDDVITTGATAQAMSQMLYAAGAAKVEVWAVARTV
jgi:ComF family protein